MGALWRPICFQIRAMTYQQLRLHAAAALLLAASIGMHAESATTGALSGNIIGGAGTYTWSPTISAPFGTANGTLTVEHNLWSDPALNVHAIVNGTDVGSFVVEMPPFFGSSIAVLNIGGLLVDGVNTITFDGGGGSGAEYSINRVTVNFDLLPEPPAPPVTNVVTNVVMIAVSTNNVPSFSPATVLHYLTRSPLDVPEGSLVSGGLRLQYNAQKNSSMQKFDLNASGLLAGSNYALVAVTATETNEAAMLTSDKLGRVRASYLGKGQGNSNGKKAFPAELDPVTDLVAVGLMDGANPVAWTWVNTSPQFQYLVKCNLIAADTGSGAAGAVFLKANAENIKFSVGAAGLTPGAPYHLALNSVVVASLLADADGRVGFVGWPVSGPSVIDLRAVEVLNASSNVVLNTVLP
jgi:hypothetical protein